MPVLAVKDLKKHFPVRKGLLRRTVGQVYAVDGISFSIGVGETLGLVGESGCGKTTTSRCILRALAPTEGQILFRAAGGQVLDVAALGRRELRPLRRQMQMIFQDPFSSLNPRRTLLDIVAEPLVANGIGTRRERLERVVELLRLVGLRPEYMRRYPHAFSGGQRQRIGIARALAVQPKMLVCDEAVAALDVSIQAQILNLLKRLQSELSLTYVLISHNLGVVSHICDRVAVMYLGRIVESAPRAELFFEPKHPYTEALLHAVPLPEPGSARRRSVLSGDIPSPANPPAGCAFHPRCPRAMPRCSHEAPLPTRLPGGHVVACHLHGA